MHTLWLLLLLLASPLATALNPLSEESAPDAMFPASIEELTFSVGGDRLSGLLYLANGLGPHPTLVLLHGFPGNEKNLDLAQAARRAGFNVMFFHYRGAWGSEGDYSLPQLSEDVAAALGFLRDHATRYRVNAQRLSLLGHSMGGYAALAAGSRDPGVSCVGALAPVNLGLWTEGIRAGEPEAMQFLEYADSLFMLRNFDGARMRRELLSMPLTDQDTRLFAAGLRNKSVLMIVGRDDTVTPADSMFDPTVAVYARDPAIDLRHFTISGDHSFSWSRLQLTELVLGWLDSDCR